MTTPVTPRFLQRTSPPHIATLILIAGLSALSMNIFLPSLPHMAEYFQTDYKLMQLSVALYLGINAALQIIVGPISDRYGRRPVILAGSALFLVATLGCIYAPNITVFLTCRMAQAVIVTGMVLSRAVVRDMVPQEQAASMIGYVTMGMSIVPMVGPAIGGILDTAFGWQANFWLLFILGAATLWLAWADLGETSKNRATSLGAQIRQYPELLTSQRFWGYCLTAAFASGAFFAYLGGAPFVGTKVYGLDPSQLGLLFGAPAVGYMLGNFLSGRYSVRFGINAMMLWGTVLSAAGLLVSILTFYAGFGSVYVFFAFMSFVGLGNGMVLPNANAGMLSVRPHLAGSASGLGGAIMIGGGAALSALAGTLLTPENGALTLVWIMLISSALGIVSGLWVIRRARMVAPD
ncbi:multidrug effflux MFS transporter [Pseudogemmobacter sp. W21_MBD1_M6]|uniref:multidrug effflux MFS transporter n=1 Tax=Pseudogemmobacter sp. W21_MBD1_M6 TaxID=3240271 RepID=UPI003F96E952